MVTAGAPRYGPPLEMPPEEARRGLTERLLLALEVARGAARKVRPPGSLISMGGTGKRRPRAGLGIASTATVALSTLIANLALELAPIRVNLIAAGFVDTPLSASILGDDLDMVIVSYHGAQIAFVGIFCGFARARLNGGEAVGIAQGGRPSRAARGDAVELG